MNTIWGKRESCDRHTICKKNPAVLEKRRLSKDSERTLWKHPRSLQRDSRVIKSSSMTGQMMDYKMRSLIRGFRHIFTASRLKKATCGSLRWAYQTCFASCWTENMQFKRENILRPKQLVTYTLKGQSGPCVYRSIIEAPKQLCKSNQGRRAYL